MKSRSAILVALVVPTALVAAVILVAAISERKDEQRRLAATAAAQLDLERSASFLRSPPPESSTDEIIRHCAKFGTNDLDEQVTATCAAAHLRKALELISVGGVESGAAKSNLDHARRWGATEAQLQEATMALLEAGIAAQRRKLIKAAEDLTRNVHSSHLKGWDFRAVAAGDACATLYIEFGVRLEESMVQAMHNGTTGFYSRLFGNGGIAAVAARGGFTSIVYRGHDGSRWWYGTYDGRASLVPCVDGQQPN